MCVCSVAEGEIKEHEAGQCEFAQRKLGSAVANNMCSLLLVPVCECECECEYIYL